MCQTKLNIRSEKSLNFFDGSGNFMQVNLTWTWTLQSCQVRYSWNFLRHTFRYHINSPTILFPVGLHPMGESLILSEWDGWFIFLAFDFKRFVSCSSSHHCCYGSTNICARTKSKLNLVLHLISSIRWIGSWQSAYFAYCGVAQAENRDSINIPVKFSIVRIVVPIPVCKFKN